MPQNMKKNLKNKRLSMALKQISDPVQRQEIVSEYALLLAEHNDKNKMLMRHLQNAILPAVAVYRVLPRHGISKTDARRIIRSNVLDAAKPMAKVFQTLGRLPFFYALFRCMCKASMGSMFGDAGWNMQWKVSNSKEIRWDCHSCFYDGVLSGYGMPELTPIFCESDDVMYGNIPGIKWGRTKTIGRGAEVCDFCFTKARHS